jgi:hypothetical protein
MRRIVVGDERAKMDDVVFVDCDLVEVGDARDVDQRIDALADAAFEFEDEVGAAGDDAGALAFYRQGFL